MISGLPLITSGLSARRPLYASEAFFRAYCLFSTNLVNTCKAVLSRLGAL